VPDTPDVHPDFAASVVIPTRNRASMLATCLRSVLEQDLDAVYEVIVLDDGSSDHTRAVVEQVRGVSRLPTVVRYEWQAGHGLNAARNRGAALARGPLVCYVDDDVDTPSSWLRGLVEGMRRHTGAEALGGPILLRIEGREPRHCKGDRLPETHLDYGPADLRDKRLYGANLAVRRSALERVGGFDEAMGIYGDEEEWQDRLLSHGGHSVYLADAWLWHRRTPAELGYWYLMRRSYKTGYGHVPYLASIGLEPSFPGEFMTIVRGFGHASVFGCFYGVLRACRAWGKCRRLWDLRRASDDA